MSDIDKLRLHCLNATCDDYENIASIQSQVFHDARVQLEPEQIIDYLKSLERENLVDVFVYDVAEESFKPVRDAGRVDFRNCWFLINQNGRRYLGDHWPEMETSTPGSASK
jgi:hypothetical protein